MLRHCKPAALLSLLLSLLLTQEGSAQNLTLTVSASPPVRGVVSTARRDDRTLVVASGQTVSLQRARGIEQRQRAAGGWFWTQIEDVPRDAERLVLTPRLLEDGRIEASVESVHKEGTRLSSYRSVLLVQPGEWTRLFATGLGAAPQSRATTTYGTSGGSSGDSLYLRIDP